MEEVSRGRKLLDAVVPYQCPVSQISIGLIVLETAEIARKSNLRRLSGIGWALYIFERRYTSVQ